MIDGHVDTLASTYAQSLLQLADEAGGRDLITDIGEELKVIVSLAEQDKLFHEFLTSVIVPVKKRGESLNRIFQGQLNDLTLRFLLVLNRKGRLGHIAAIEQAYRALREEKFGYVAVRITTAAELSGDDVVELTARLREALGKEPLISTSVDSQLIGGMKLQIGDELIDASVAARLRKMSEQLLQSGAQIIRDKAEELIES